MTRAPGRGALFAATLAAAAAFPLGAGEAPAGRLPFGVAVAVRWGRPLGPEAFRRDLARSLESEMAERCFARVVPEAPEAGTTPAELRLSVVLGNVEDATVFDGTLAKALDPDDPDRGTGQVAQFSVDVEATLAVAATGAVVVRTDLHAATSRRPLTAGEDAQAYARADAVVRIVGDLRKRLCGGGADRKVRRALGDAASAGR